MVAEFRWVYTAVGLAKRAAAEAGGAWPQITTFAVGDGGGVYHEPEELLAGLINETWRGPVNRRYIHAEEPNLVVIEAAIPADQGGWTIREAGMIDEDDDLVAVGKYPATEKPAPGSGGEKQIYVRGGVRISNGGDLVVQIGESLVMATQEYVDTHAALQVAHGSTSEATADKIMQRDAAGRAKVAAPAADDDIARKDTVTAAIDALIAAAPGALDTLNELAVALGNDANFATTITNLIATHAALQTAHGSTSAATANKLMQRDVNGRAKVAAPAADDDIARKDTVDNAVAGLGTALTWVNFSGTTATIRGSNNVSSITDNSAGNFNVNFSSNLADANYAAIATSGATGFLCSAETNKDGSPTVATCNITTVNMPTQTPADAQYVHFAAIN